VLVESVQVRIDAQQHPSSSNLRGVRPAYGRQARARADSRTMQTGSFREAGRIRGRLTRDAELAGTPTIPSAGLDSLARSMHEGHDCNVDSGCGDQLDRAAVLQLVAREDDNALARLDPGEHLSGRVAALADLDRPADGPVAVDDEHRPSVAFAHQAADRYGHGIVGRPDDHPDLHAVAVPELREGGSRVI